MVLLLPQFRQGVLQPDAQPLVGSLGRLPDALGYEGGSCLYGSLGDVAPQNAPDEHGGKISPVPWNIRGCSGVFTA